MVSADRSPSRVDVIATDYTASERLHHQNVDAVMATEGPAEISLRTAAAKSYIIMRTRMLNWQMKTAHVKHTAGRFVTTVTRGLQSAKKPR